MGYHNIDPTNYYPCLKEMSSTRCTRKSPRAASKPCLLSKLSSLIWQLFDTKMEFGSVICCKEFDRKTQPLLNQSCAHNHIWYIIHPCIDAFICERKGIKYFATNPQEQFQTILNAFTTLLLRPISSMQCIHRYEHACICMYIDS
jgi:hypothetical protein